LDNIRIHGPYELLCTYVRSFVAASLKEVVAFLELVTFLALANGCASVFRPRQLVPSPSARPRRGIAFFQHDHTLNVSKEVTSEVTRVHDMKSQ